MRAEYPLNQFCRLLKCPNSLRSLVWASGLIPLGSLHLRPLQRHFNVLGLTVYFITLIRPTSPCQPTWTLAVMSIHFFSLVVSLSDLSRRSS